MICLLISRDFSDSLNPKRFRVSSSVSVSIEAPDGVIGKGQCVPFILIVIEVARSYYYTRPKVNKRHSGAAVGRFTGPYWLEEERVKDP